MSDQGKRNVTALHQGIAMLQRGIDTLIEQAADSWESLGREATDLYRELERQRNRLALVDTHFLTGTRSFRPAAKHKQVQWMVSGFPINATDARSRVRTAQRINDAPDPETITSTNPLGSQSDSFIPSIREAVSDGVLNSAAVAKIHAGISALPAEHQADITVAADGHLAELARQQGPVAMDGIGRQLTRLFNLEGRFTGDDRNRKRSIRLGKQEYDGMTCLTGLITPRFAAVIQRLFADYAKSGDLANRMASSSGKSTDNAEVPDTELTAENDPRSPAQRAHDALESSSCRRFLPRSRSEEYRLGRN